MRHLSVMAAGLLTSTMLTGLCVAAQDDSSQNAPAPVEQAQPDQASPPQSTDSDPPAEQSRADGETQAEASGQAEMGKSDADQARDDVQPGTDDDETAQTEKNADEDDADEDDDAKSEQTAAAETGSDQAQPKMTQPEEKTQPSDTEQTSKAAQPSNDGGDNSRPVDQAQTGDQAAHSETAPAAPQAQETAQDKKADQDFGRLSDDGSSAFADIHLARLAIFDGNIEEAAKLISDAQEALRRASNDNTVFMKAEAELNGPSEPREQAPGMQAKEPNPIAWLPIDGQLIVGETYKPTSQNAAAVVNARKSLRKGQSDEALKAIRMAEVDVDYTMALAPLQQSLADISMANQMMGDHDYYAALQALKQAEDGIRYDEIDDVAHVKRNAANSDAKSNG